MGGMVLFPVVVAAALLAVIALAMRLDAAGTQYQARAAGEARQAGRALESAFAAAEDTLARAGCGAYAMADTALGDHTLSASFSPTSGSPVAITASATLANGNTRSATRSDIRAWETDDNELVLPAAGDAWLNAGATGENHGADTALDAASGANAKQPLLYFDLGDIPDGTRIASARLELYVTSASGAGLAPRGMSTNWTEGSCTGSGCTADGATWASYDGTTPWASAGGDFGLPAATTINVSTADAFTSWDITHLVREWQSGTRDNHGLVLSTETGGSTRFASREAADSGQHPRLVVNYRCECGVDCVPEPETATFCDADFTPNRLVREVNPGNAGAGTLFSATYVPGDTSYAGGTTPSAGGMLYADSGSSTVRLTDLDGNLLASHSARFSGPRGVAYITSGTRAGGIALSDRAGMRIDLHDAEGNWVADFDTVAFSREPKGLAWIDTTESGTYDALLAVTSHTAASGYSEARVHFVDLAGTAMHSIDVSAMMSQPNGIAHLPGTDKLLVVDQGGRAIIIDFDGNLLREYETADFGLSMPAEAGILGSTCDHLLVDYGTDRLYVVRYYDPAPAAHWRFDEGSGSLAADSIGNHDGDVSKAGWVTGASGDALEFAGDGEVRVEDTAELDLVDAFTIAVWVQHTGTDGVILSKGSGEVDLNYHLQISPTAITFAFSDGDTVIRFEAAMSFAFGFTADTWHHIVATYSDADDQVVIYLNGTPVHSETTTARPVANTRRLFIGTTEYEGNDFTGTLDEIQIFASALPADDVTALYEGVKADVDAGGSGGTGDGSCGAYADDFESGGYSGATSGSRAWTSIWTEYNEGDGSSSGDEQIVSFSGSHWARVRDNDGGGEGLYREFDMTRATSATLIVNLRRDGLDNSDDYIAISGHDLAASRRVLLQTIAGPGTDSSTRTLKVDLSTLAGVERAAVSFITSSTMGGSDSLYMDDVTISIDACK